MGKYSLKLKIYPKAEIRTIIVQYDPKNTIRSFFYEIFTFKEFDNVCEYVCCAYAYEYGCIYVFVCVSVQ